MRETNPTVTYTRLLVTGLSVGLGLLTTSASVHAQASYTAVNCSVQSVGAPPGQVTWQIRGTATVGGLPAGTSQVQTSFEFQTLAPGGANWQPIQTVNQTVKPAGGTASLDTGFITFTPAPAQGT